MIPRLYMAGDGIRRTINEADLKTTDTKSRLSTVGSPERIRRWLSSDWVILEEYTGRHV